MTRQELKIRSRFVMYIFDFIIGVIAFYTAFYLRFDGNIPTAFLESFYGLWFVYVLGKGAVFHFLGIYKRIWQYAGTRDLIAVVYSLTISVLLLVAAGYFLRINVPRSVFIFTWMLDVILTGGIKIIPKLYRERNLAFLKYKNVKRIIVVGAGDAGVLVVKELLRRENPTMLPVGFVDDDLTKQNQRILGLPVLGTRNKLKQILQKNAIEEVLIAMPSATGQVVKEVVDICREVGVSVRTLPKMYDIINGQISVDLIREVKLEDLLGRETVSLDMDTIMHSIRKKRILVTGAGGSIGSELCRQICGYDPQELLLLGHDENPIFEIELELKSRYPQLRIKPIIADVKDFNRVLEVFHNYRPQIVFHAAAHKHVPLMEYNPEESFKNNVLGTKNIAEASDKYNVESFVLISTDKAVNPSSVMGATKRIAEIIIQHINEYSKTRYVAVRFGNVLGSRGSVIPIFQEQIKKGGPVTVTHPDMCRYFMTIPEAVQLVLQASSMAVGGEIFILDMGKPVKILEMARELIRLSGLEPDKDIEILFTGIRPGEKLYEEILTDSEGTTATKHKRIYIAKEQKYNQDSINALFCNIAGDNYFDSKELIFNVLNQLERDINKNGIGHVS